MIPLLLCSLLSLTVSLERLYFWVHTTRELQEDCIESIFECVKAGGIEDIITESILPRDARAKILVLALKEEGPDLAVNLQLGIMLKAEAMKRGLMILETIITLAPLLGILGTVTGIIASFEVLGLEGTAQPQAVSHGIAKALVTTAFGLGIAIASVIPFNYFQSRMAQFLQEMQRHAAHLVALVQRDQEMTDND